MPFARGPLPFLLAVAGVVSVLTAAVGARTLLAFDHAGGASGTAPLQWPAETALQRPDRRQILLLFVHPRCSCTVATLRELSRLTSRTGTSFPVLQILFSGSGSPGDRGAVRDRTRELGGAQLVWDAGGREARRFGALTSGDAFLYGIHGDLLFHGGLTGARGHEGDNYGEDRLAAAITTGHAERAKGLVFGCSLFRPEERQ